MNESEKTVREALGHAGIQVGGGAPWDVEVKDPRFYPRVLRGGSLGLGESYIDGWWECQRIDQLIARVLRARVERKMRPSARLLWANFQAWTFNLQRSSRAYPNVAHYDLGNELFERMLGPTMAYSCGYWRNAATLDEAQRNKFDLCCRKLMLRPGERLLDIGCGFGTLARFAAQQYGCQVVGVTLSRQHHAYATQVCAGLPVEILLADYRDQRLARLGPFDKIVSVGMFEHVGVKNYRRYMEIACSLLKDEGLFLLHTIGTGVSRRIGDPYLHKYVFPNGVLPSPTNLGQAMEGLLVLEDLHNFGADYHPTFMAWLANFDQYAGSREFPHDVRFTRMWRFFLQLFGGGFLGRNLTQLWQLVASKEGVPGGYPSVR